mmetsp:Transcript_28052/g.38781  ORF Transcript_28052/g.38781 Transcript_28052/m.38781 type:complete len:466 (+) Transcript_28052:92-1489(+)
MLQTEYFNSSSRANSTSPVSPLGFEAFVNGNDYNHATHVHSVYGGEHFQPALSKPTNNLQQNHHITYKAPVQQLDPERYVGNGYFFAEQQHLVKEPLYSKPELFPIHHSSIDHGIQCHKSSFPPFVPPPQENVLPILEAVGQVPFYNCSGNNFPSSMVAQNTFQNNQFPVVHGPSVFHQQPFLFKKAVCNSLPQLITEVPSGVHTTDSLNEDSVAQEAISSLEAAVAMEAAFARKSALSAGNLPRNNSMRNLRFPPSVSGASTKKSCLNEGNLRKSESMGNLNFHSPRAATSPEPFDLDDKVVENAASALEEALKREALKSAPKHKPPVARKPIMPINRNLPVELLLPDEIIGSVTTSDEVKYVPFYPRALSGTNGTNSQAPTVHHQEGFYSHHTQNVTSQRGDWHSKQEIDLSPSAYPFVPSFATSASTKVKDAFSLGALEEADFSKFLGELSVQNLPLNVERS